MGSRLLNMLSLHPCTRVVHSSEIRKLRLQLKVKYNYSFIYIYMIFCDEE